MRVLMSVPGLALVIAAYNVLGLSASMLQSESLLVDFVLPSGAELFLKVGDLLLALGLLALFFEVLKAARPAAMVVLDHMLSIAVFIVALVELLLVEFCGTSTFALLVAMSLVDVVAGFSVSILAARRDLALTRSGD